MSNYNFSRDIYIVLNSFLLFLSVVAIIVGVLINDYIPIFVGIAWFIIALLRILIVSNNNGNETRPLISHV